MFGFSFGEVLVISVVALIALGPERIPQVARTLGRILAELRRATDEVKREFAIHDLMHPVSPTASRSGLRAEPIKLEHIPEELPELADSSSVGSSISEACPQDTAAREAAAREAAVKEAARPSTVLAAAPSPDTAPGTAPDPIDVPAPEIHSSGIAESAQQSSPATEIPRAKRPASRRPKNATPSSEPSSE